MKKFYTTLIALLAIAHLSYAQWTNQTGTSNYYIAPGNVGIGTTTPAVPLDVAGTQIHLADPATTPSANYSYFKTTGFTFNTQTLTFGTTYGYNTPVDALSIYNGKVGIGTTTPGEKLDVVGAIHSTISSGSNLILSKPTGSGIDFNNGSGVTNALIEADNSNNRLEFWTNNSSGSALTERMRIDNAGNVGIGTTGPLSYKLALSSSDYRILSLNSTYGQVGVDFANSGTYFGSIGSGSNMTPTGAYNDFGLGTNGTTGNLVFATGTAYTERMRITNNGSILIGKTSQYPGVNYKLDIGGSARADKVVVNTTGADFVFADTYKLPKLNEVKAYINQNHHLPEIPSAAEMQKNGMDVGELNTKLLQKVEELTLYLIEKDEKEKKKDAQIQSQQQQINELKEQVSDLVKLLKKQ